jgi:hypothetical protein
MWDLLSRKPSRSSGGMRTVRQRSREALRDARNVGHASRVVRFPTEVAVLNYGVAGFQSNKSGMACLGG